MQKKKGIIIAIIVAFIIIILGGAGIYIFTDLFKSEKQLFYKYLLDKNNMISMIENTNTNQNKSSYKATTDVNYIYQYNNSIEKIENDQIVKNLQDNIKSFEFLRGINAKVESKVDSENKKQHHIINLKKIDKDILKINVVKNENKYAFKIDEIIKAYIGLEDANIRELASKLELPSAENLPNKIDIDNDKYKELFNLSKEEKEHIEKKYKDILYKEIQKDNYSKENNVSINIEENNYNVNKYTLKLNNEQTINISLKLLEELKQDSITLNLICNKIKIMNPESEYANINKLNEVIQKYIEELQKQEKNQDEYINLSVYEYKGKTIRIDLNIKGEKKLQLDYLNQNGEQKLYINQMFTKNQSGAIIYDIKTSMMGANNIILTKTDRYLGIEVKLYDIKEIYKTILDEMNTKYEEQQNNGNNDVTDITKITKEEIEEIEEIYKQYQNIDSNSISKIGFTIEILEESDTESFLSTYINVCDSKIGMKMKISKEYTKDIGQIEDINEKNTAFLNKYSKEQIENVLNKVYNRIISIIKENFNQNVNV